MGTVNVGGLEIPQNHVDQFFHHLEEQSEAGDFRILLSSISEYGMLLSGMLVGKLRYELRTFNNRENTTVDFFSLEDFNRFIEESKWLLTIGGEKLE